MEKPEAVGVLHIEADFILLFLIEAARARTVQAYLAANDDSEALLTAPDFEKWTADDGFRKLRTRALNADQKNRLRTNFIEEQIFALKQNYYPLEIATNKSVADRVLFSFFGQGWGVGWKAKARAASATSTVNSPFLRYLRMQFPSVDVAYLGAIYLAIKHGVNQPSQAEREAEAIDRILSGAGAHLIQP